MFVLFTNQKPAVKGKQSVHLVQTDRRVLNQ
jgi:hypothetical protein